MGSLGAHEIGIGAQIAADLTRGETVSAKCADHDMRVVLTDALAHGDNLLEGSLDGCGGGLVGVVLIDLSHEGFGGFEQGTVWQENSRGVGVQFFEKRHKGGFPEELIGGQGCGGIGGEKHLPGFLAGETRAEETGAGKDFNQAGSCDFELVVGLKDGKGTDVIAEVVFAGDDGGWSGVDFEAPIEELLVRQQAWGEAGFAVAVRDGVLRGVAGSGWCAGRGSS
jgi:hypothetical protein